MFQRKVRDYSEFPVRRPYRGVACVFKPRYVPDRGAGGGASVSAFACIYNEYSILKLNI